MNILEDLRNRGIFDNVTSEAKMNSLKLGSGVYIGFDPTAISLHLGNYIQIALLKRFALYGFKTVAIVGGATGMIGDPSGKSEERNLLDEETLLNNKQKIKFQLEGFGLQVIDNLDFYKDMNILTFLREVGKQVNVSVMLSRDIVKNRLADGLSFTEFSYQLIQGWDFKTLYEKHNVQVQVGGSDQWGNIVSGVDIIRKTLGEKADAIGLTVKLLTTASGKKFGKSEGNAIWLDPKLTSPFALYQYLLNTSDEDIEKMLLWLTFESVDEINQVMSKHKTHPAIREAQKFFAACLITDIHGKEALQTALELTELVFGQGSVASQKASTLLQLAGSIPTFDKLEGPIIEVLKQANIVSSNREAKEFLVAGAIEVNGKIIHDESFVVSQAQAIEGQVLLIRKGKKKYSLVKY